MKIIQFIASKNRGGAENVVASLSNILSNHPIDVELLLLPKSALAHQINVNLPINYLHFSSRFNPLLYLELLWFFWHKKPDIIHTHSAKATEIIYRIRHFISAKHIATKHNARKGEIFSKISHVTAVSKDVQKSILPNKSTIIYNGITPIMLKNTPILNSKFTILAVGRLDKIKGFDILIHECSKLTFDFILEIVGEGNERNKLENLIEALHMKTKVNLVGFQDDIPQRMHKADIVVMCSHSEGFPITMLETLFYAKLFISTSVGGCKEILSPDLIINRFDIAEKLEDVFLHLNSYQTLFAELCQKHKDTFLLTTITQEYIKYYHEVLNS